MYHATPILILLAYTYTIGEMKASLNQATNALPSYMRVVVSLIQWTSRQVGSHGAQVY